MKNKKYIVLAITFLAFFGQSTFAMDHLFNRVTDTVKNAATGVVKTTKGLLFTDPQQEEKERFTIGVNETKNKPIVELGKKLLKDYSSFISDDEQTQLNEKIRNADNHKTKNDIDLRAQKCDELFQLEKTVLKGIFETISDSIEKEKKNNLLLLNTLLSKRVEDFCLNVVQYKRDCQNKNIFELTDLLPKLNNAKQIDSDIKALDQKESVVVNPPVIAEAPEKIEPLVTKTEPTVASTSPAAVLPNVAQPDAPQQEPELTVALSADEQSLLEFAQKLVNQDKEKTDDSIYKLIILTPENKQSIQQSYNHITKPANDIEIADKGTYIQELTASIRKIFNGWVNTYNANKEALIGEVPHITSDQDLEKHQAWNKAHGESQEEYKQIRASIDKAKDATNFTALLTEMQKKQKEYDAQQSKNKIQPFIAPAPQPDPIVSTQPNSTSPAPEKAPEKTEPTEAKLPNVVQPEAPQSPAPQPELTVVLSADEKSVLDFVNKLINQDTEADDSIYKLITLTAEEKKGFAQACNHINNPKIDLEKDMKPDFINGLIGSSRSIFTSWIFKVYCENRIKLNNLQNPMPSNSAPFTISEAMHNARDKGHQDILKDCEKMCELIRNAKDVSTLITLLTEMQKKQKECDTLLQQFASKAAATLVLVPQPKPAAPVDNSASASSEASTTSAASLVPKPVDVPAQTITKPTSPEPATIPTKNTGELSLTLKERIDIAYVDWNNFIKRGIELVTCNDAMTHDDNILIQKMLKQQEITETEASAVFNANPKSNIAQLLVKLGYINNYPDIEDLASLEKEARGYIGGWNFVNHAKAYGLDNDDTKEYIDGIKSRTKSSSKSDRTNANQTLNFIEKFKKEFNKKYPKIAIPLISSNPSAIINSQASVEPTQPTAPIISAPQPEPLVSAQLNSSAPEKAPEKNDPLVAKTEPTETKLPNVAQPDAPQSPAPQPKPAAPVDNSASASSEASTKVDTELEKLLKIININLKRAGLSLKSNKFNPKQLSDLTNPYQAIKMDNKPELTLDTVETIFDNIDPEKQDDEHAAQNFKWLLTFSGKIIKDDKLKDAFKEIGEFENPLFLPIWAFGLKSEDRKNKFVTAINRFNLLRGFYEQINVILNARGVDLKLDREKIGLGYGKVIRVISNEKNSAPISIPVVTVNPSSAVSSATTAQQTTQPKIEVEKNDPFLVTELPTEHSSTTSFTPASSPAPLNPPAINAQPNTELPNNASALPLAAPANSSQPSPIVNPPAQTAAFVPMSQEGFVALFKELGKTHSINFSDENLTKLIEFYNGDRPNYIDKVIKWAHAIISYKKLSNEQLCKHIQKWLETDHKKPLFIIKSTSPEIPNDASAPASPVEPVAIQQPASPQPDTSILSEINSFVAFKKLVKECSYIRETKEPLYTIIRSNNIQSEDVATLEQWIDSNLTKETSNEKYNENRKKLKEFLVNLIARKKNSTTKDLLIFAPMPVPTKATDIPAVNPPAANGGTVPATKGTTPPPAPQPTNTPGQTNPASTQPTEPQSGITNPGNTPAAPQTNIPDEQQSSTVPTPDNSPEQPDASNNQPAEQQENPKLAKDKLIDLCTSAGFDDTKINDIKQVDQISVDWAKQQITTLKDDVPAEKTLKDALTLAVEKAAQKSEQNIDLLDIVTPEQPKAQPWSLSKRLFATTGIFGAVLAGAGIMYKGFNYITTMRTTALKKNCATLKQLMNKTTAHTITLADYTAISKDLPLINGATHATIKGYIENKGYEALHTLLKQEYARLYKLAKAHVFKRIAFAIKADLDAAGSWFKKLTTAQAA